MHFLVDCRNFSKYFALPFLLQVLRKAEEELKNVAEELGQS
jgi:hypothetical protein